MAISKNTSYRSLRGGELIEILKTKDREAIIVIDSHDGLMIDDLETEETFECPSPIAVLLGPENLFVPSDLKED